MKKLFALVMALFVAATAVLPALGEMSVGQTTIEDLVATTLRRAHAKAAIRGADPAPVAALKGDPCAVQFVR